MNQAQVLSYVADLFTEKMPFNKMLGLRVTKYTTDEVEVSFDWKDDFIGNPLQKILHGGVTSSVMDVVGGMMAVGGLLAKAEDITETAFLNSLGTLGTIDMRTDFLRPGRGESFVASARLIRTGNKVCVCRMEL
ncbi:MAG: thioesterase family protein, partial [Algicola sp.]|nr:thioesterase family protein [Algicola sp.]